MESLILWLLIVALALVGRSLSVLFCKMLIFKGFDKGSQMSVFVLRFVFDDTIVIPCPHPPYEE